MSTMLSRFRKPGGFQQLLTLIETCEPAKQKSLLHLVSSEDPGWAHLVKVKALTFERILTWPEEVLMEITPHLPDAILATAYRMAEQVSVGKPLSLHEKWINCLPSMKAKEIRALAKTLAFAPSEQFSSSIKIIQTVRELTAKGQLKFISFDPSLEIDNRLAA
jgi:hypothetical protein